MLGRKSYGLVLMFMLLSCVFFDQTYRISAVSVYEVVDPQFPPDLFGDINKDGKVNMPDLSLLARALGTTSASGGTPPAWGAWNPACDIVLDNRINGLDVAYVTTNYGKEDSPPVAYSTDFEFAVPNNGDSEVHYYVYAKFYVPFALHEQKLYFDASVVDDWVLNVKIDKSLIYAGSTGNPAGQPLLVELGSLQFGYHLLEFEFVEKSGSGNLHFDVATASGEKAWLSRFRVCVPDYGDNEYRYTVKTRTYFPGDDFFLGGYADDFIDDVYVDVGLVWQDWMWDMGPTYGAIYAWGDGFMYPLERRDGWHDITFTFGDIWQAGLLDFQYISWTKQGDKIGQPKFYAETSFESGMQDAWVGDKRFYAGSMWYNETNPGKSKRYILTEQEVTFSDVCNGARIRLGIGIGWAWLTSREFPDFGVMLNLTYVSSIKDKRPFDYIDLVETFAEVYTPEQAFNTVGVEFSGSGQSTISTAWTIVERFFTSCLVPIATKFGGPAGALLGIASGTTIDAVFDYAKNQQESQVDQGGNSTHLIVGYSPFLGSHLSVLHTTLGTSSSHLLFIRLNPMSSGNCGTVRVVLHGVVLCHVTDGFDVASFNTAICFPWFVD